MTERWGTRYTREGKTVWTERPLLGLKSVRHDADAATTRASSPSALWGPRTGGRPVPLSGGTNDDRRALRGFFVSLSDISDSEWNARYREAGCGCERFRPACAAGLTRQFGAARPDLGPRARRCFGGPSGKPGVPSARAGRMRVRPPFPAEARRFRAPVSISSRTGVSPDAEPTTFGTLATVALSHERRTGASPRLPSLRPSRRDRPGSPWTRTADAVDADPSDGALSRATGTCSLRAPTVIRPRTPDRGARSAPARRPVRLDRPRPDPCSFVRSRPDPAPAT